MNTPDALLDDLARLLRRRWLVVGIGNRLRGDDAFGPLLALRLRSLGLPAIDVATAPENFTGPILAAAPDQLIVADAADMGEEVGTVRLFEPAQAGPGGVSTHDPGLALVLNHLYARRAMSAVLLAVQPGSRGLGQPVSAEVGAVLDGLVELFRRASDVRREPADGAELEPSAGSPTARPGSPPHLRRTLDLTFPSSGHGASRPPRKESVMRPNSAQWPIQTVIVKFCTILARMVAEVDRTPENRF